MMHAWGRVTECMIEDVFRYFTQTSLRDWGHQASDSFSFTLSAQCPPGWLSSVPLPAIYL